MVRKCVFRPILIIGMLCLGLSKVHAQGTVISWPSNCGTITVKPRFKLNDTTIWSKSIVSENSGRQYYVTFENKRVFTTLPENLTITSELNTTCANAMTQDGRLFPSAVLKLFIAVKSDRQDDDGKPIWVRVWQINGHTINPDNPGDDFVTQVTNWNTPVPAKAGVYVQKEISVIFPAAWLRSPLPAPIKGTEPLPAINEIRFSTYDDDNPDFRLKGTRCMTQEAYLGFSIYAPFVFVHGANDAGKVWYMMQTKTLPGTSNHPGGETYLNIMQWFDEQGICYSRDINLGQAIPFWGKYTGADSISNNARQLVGQLPTALKKFGATECNLIAHSKGGLDSRAFLSFPAYAQMHKRRQLRVRSLTTLDTPHLGSPLADSTWAYFLKYRDQILTDDLEPIVLDRVNQLRRDLGIFKTFFVNNFSFSYNCIYDLTTSFMVSANEVLATEDKLSLFDIRLNTIMSSADLNGDDVIDYFEAAGEPKPSDKNNRTSGGYSWPSVHNWLDDDFSDYSWVPALNDLTSEQMDERCKFYDLQWAILNEPGWELDLPNKTMKPTPFPEGYLFGSDLRVPLWSSQYKPAYQLGGILSANHVRVRNRSVGENVYLNALKQVPVKINFEKAEE